MNTPCQPQESQQNRHVHAAIGPIVPLRPVTGDATPLPLQSSPRYCLAVPGFDGPSPGVGFEAASVPAQHDRSASPMTSAVTRP